MKKCYFCHACLHDSPQKVRMYDGRIVESCYICRGLVADAKSVDCPSSSFGNNSVLGIVGGDKID